MSSSPSVSAPVRIVIVDVARPLADLDLRHPSGGTYKAVWVLAMRGDRPVGIATIPVSSETLRADDLERHLRESLGEAFDLNVMQHELGGRAAQGIGHRCDERRPTGAA